MTDDQTKQSPFQRAEAEARAARQAAAAKAAPSDRPTPAPTAPGRAVFGRGPTQTDARAPFLATEAAQHLKLQQERMENARAEAARVRLSLEVERHKSHIFIKRQELARVATRLRAAESALVAAEADLRRATAGLGASAGAIHEKSSARDHLAAQRADAERDFERREIAEGKAVQAIEREMEKLAKRAGSFVQNTPQYRDLERRKHDRERGLASIRLERARRRAESTSKDAALARQVASAERSEVAANRSLALAQGMVAKYRQQVHAFSVAKQALDADLERMGKALSAAEAAVRQAAATAHRS